jgi:acetyltransferase-like isoleucine patch superfamily enzyme
MIIGNHVSAILKRSRRKLTRLILAHRVCAMHPTLNSDPTAIWDYGYNDIGYIRLGNNVTVCAFTEILMYRRSPHSSVEGGLTLGDNVIIGSGAVVRAAGGQIIIGNKSGIAQNSVVVAANHLLAAAGQDRLRVSWDEERCGVTVGDNVWVGANCVLLPGCRIGDNSIIGAGAVVRGEVPANELWAGVPAKRIRSLGTLRAEAAPLRKESADRD